ncbi:conserved hypothetical protein [uncultured Desulfatiglans sp.]|nr:conserved hypothetical protein [uncultured Desulfatiglans sp.]
MNIQAKRVYDPVDEKDGSRVLVDRLWPRGMKKDRLEADEWLKDAAPSNELRKWYAHDPAKWEAFRRRYFDELDQKPEVIDRLRSLASEGTLTLLYSAKDLQYNQAVALMEYLLSKSS